MKTAAARTYTDINSNLSFHSPFTPEDVRINDPIKVKLFDDKGTHSLQVWRMSPFGVEAIFPEYVKMEIGSHVQLKIQVGKQIIDQSASYIGQREENSNLLSCFRFTYEKDSFTGVDRRQNTRWICSHHFFPTGIASSPAKLNDFIYFKIEDISYGGMKITCSLRNKFLLPGMHLSSMINFPLTSQIQVKLIIDNITIARDGDKDIMRIGVRWSPDNLIIRETVCNYLMQFSDANSYNELESQGFFTKKISSAIDFRYVKSETDYISCLKLRHLANKQAGKLQTHINYEDMAEPYDARSRLVLGAHKEKAVCTVRLAFHELDDCMEIESYTKLPDSFPRRDDCVEIMRLCTHPQYRGSDLLISLFKHLAITVVQSRRRYIVTSCVEKLKPLYKKVGFKDTGLSYLNPLFPDHPDHIMLADIKTLLTAKGMNPLVWNMVWGDLYNYFDEYDIYEYTPYEKLRIKAIRTLNPIANIYSNRVRKR